MRGEDAAGTVGMVSTDPESRGPPERPPAPFTERHWLAIVVTGVLLALALTFIALPVPYPRVAGVHVVVAVVACLPMLLLRRWPLSVLAVSAVASALVIASGIAPLPLAVLLGLATYLVASHLPRRISIPAAVAAAVGIGGALVYSVVTSTREAVGVLVVVGILPLAAAWFVGDAVAARRQYQAGLAEQAAREQAAEAQRARLKVREERLRIAQEVHDVVAHTLAVITVQAGVGRRLMAKRPEEAVCALESIEAIGRTAQEELRVVLDLLREEGTSAELSPAPRLVDLKELAETVRASGTDVDLVMSGTDRRLSPALELSLYRVVQEALTNVVKHAPGATASVEVVVASRIVRVEVADDGSPGGGPAGTEAVPGHGIIGMRERVAAFGGSLIAQPFPGGGFRVSAEVPIEES
jgi:signal transduction histidine kinase